jgi:uncharacterized membrane protein (UPF0127 family)
MTRRSLALRFSACLALSVALSPWVVPALAQSQGPDTGHAQPELPKEKLVIVTHDGKSHDFNVEMARTADQQTVGLMWRKTVPADGGMLFVWDHPQESDMWMHNTVAPLDMLFIDGNGTIHHIEQNAVPFSLATISSHGPVRATLELAAGTVKRLGLQPGDKVRQEVFGNAP